MSTSTTTLTERSSSPRPFSSIASLSAPYSSHTSTIARIYKEASQLFVTRRIQEALETLEPLIQKPDSLTQAESEREIYEHTNSEQQEQRLAPVATASRGARVKVWSLYISIINEVVEMGPDAGKQAFGGLQWKHFVSMARDGGLWADIVEIGYSGVEGNVDAEVVANLATLLLAHAPSQKVTQQRLETYLSASSTPALDVSGHLERGKSARNPQSNGTSTPRDLNSRLKILEIYTLHVLPRNSEWQYAREFINMSEILDDDRKEAFLQALQNIQDERDLDSRREAELKKQREQQLEDARRRDEETRRAQQAQAIQENSRKRQQKSDHQTTEDDYGVDRTRLGSRNRPPARQTNGIQHSSQPPHPGRNPAPKPSRERGPPSKHAQTSRPTVIKRFALLVQVIQHGVVSMGQNVRSHPMFLFRTLAFIVALLMALSRRDIRDRLTRARDASWDKLKRTVGMGVKVSYI